MFQRVDQTNKKCDCIPRVLIIDPMYFNISVTKNIVAKFTQDIFLVNNCRDAVSLLANNKVCGCPIYPLVFIDF